MKFEYTTRSGMKGHVAADSEQQAVASLEQQFGPEGARLIEATAQAPATAAPGTAAASASAGDPHNWATAFATAAGRSG